MLPLLLISAGVMSTLSLVCHWESFWRVYEVRKKLSDRVLQWWCCHFSVSILFSKFVVLQGVPHRCLVRLLAHLYDILSKAEFVSLEFETETKSRRMSIRLWEGNRIKDVCLMQYEKMCQLWRVKCRGFQVLWVLRHPSFTTGEIVKKAQFQGNGSKW